MSDTVVFVGPSLDPEAANEILAARFLPPIERGDIDTLLRSGPLPRAIGIVDGRFLQRLSISPKEVLRALDRGVAVFGASSMGALRAVELAPYGMVGVGQIFEMFHSGRLQADDEVAMVFDPETFRPLSEPLVNIRIAVAAAVAQGVVAEATGEAIIAAAKALYFPQRSYHAALQALGPRLDAQERNAFMAFLRTRAPDAKRDDAMEMLRRMSIAIKADGVSG